MLDFVRRSYSGPRFEIEPTEMLRIPWAKPSFTEREKQNLMAALESTWISGGAYVDQFERDFPKVLGRGSGITTSNGTTALHLALLGLDIGPGDEVLVPAFSFVAPYNMVLSVGATPVFADIDVNTWCIAADSAEGLIGPRTRAVIAVHTYGNVCNLGALASLCRNRRLALIEDTAEAAFSRYRGQHAGTYGAVGCFSFHATKTITMGEGGFVWSADSYLLDRMRVIRDHGMRKDRRYWHDVIGHNFRLTNMQAAIGCAQLERREELTAQRQRLYQQYCTLLSGAAGIQLQQFTSDVDPVVWTMAIRIERDAFGADRDDVIRSLADNGIETRPGFYPAHLLPPYDSPHMPIAEAIGLSVISLPLYPELHADDVSFICKTLLELRRRPTAS